MEVCSINKLVNGFILISLLLNKNILIESYSQVSRVGAYNNSGSNNNDNSTNSEIIVHNPGREGVFSSDNDEHNKTISEYNDDEITTIENKSTEVFTGRSSPSNGFQFPLNFNTKPISYRRPSMVKSNYNPNEKSSVSPSSSPIFVYPSSGSKSIDQTIKYSHNLPAAASSAEAMDRFSPGEAYGFQQYIKNNKNKNNNGYDYSPPKNRLPVKQQASLPAAGPPSPPSPPPPPPPPSPPVNRPTGSAIQSSAPPSAPSPVYVPPNDLYAFPPNTGSNYLPPFTSTNQRPVTSYLPPAAGVSDDFDSNSFIGPVNPKYLPSSNSPDSSPPAPGTDSGSMEMDSSPSDDSNHDHDHPPPSVDGLDDHDHHHHDHDHHHHDHDHNHDHNHSHDDLSDSQSPPAAPATENPMTQMMSMVLEALKNNNNNNNPPAAPPSSPTAPTGSDLTFSPPDHDHFNYHDHDYHGHDFHDHDHDFHDHDFHGQYGVDVYPEVIYDHDPHDHHHDIVTTTTEPPPPPEEPRVTKYSYYYLGRKLWYVPLYFTVYFTFYVASLIIRSIGRHKVEWPNHISKRSIGDMSHKETVQKVEKLTNFVMGSIEDFKEKYL